jgi:hypothetical protein
MCGLAAGDTRDGPAGRGAASWPLRSAEPAQQTCKLQRQGRLNDVGCRGAEHVADGGEEEVADRRIATLHRIGQSERARVAGPQHGCTSPPPTRENGVALLR